MARCGAPLPRWGRLLAVISDIHQVRAVVCKLLSVDAAKQLDDLRVTLDTSFWRVNHQLIAGRSKQSHLKAPKWFEAPIECRHLVVQWKGQGGKPRVRPQIRRWLSAGNKWGKAGFRGCSLGIDMNWAWISRKLLPCLEGLGWLDGIAIHRDSVRQETENRKACQKASAYTSVRLVIPPDVRRFVRHMTLNE
jgi:hypothetical protein